MRKLLPAIVVIVLIGIASFLAFTFEIPEVSVFQVFQDLDQRIIQAESKGEETLETTLEQLQVSVREVISIGQTYDGKKDVSEQFTAYQTQYDQLNQYIESAMGEVSKAIESTDFEKVEKQVTKIAPELQGLATEMVKIQTDRTTKLELLNKELQKLVTELKTFEEMFYHTKTSDTVQYFQGINSIFKNIQALHSDYMETVESYYAIKADYYEQIANKNVIDYLFN